jgi:hypothetical protein
MSTPSPHYQAAPIGGVIVPFPAKPMADRSGTPFDARVIVRERGRNAWAIYSIVLANDRDGIPNTYQTIAETLDYSVRQVIRVVQQMEESGYIYVEKGGGRSFPTTITAALQTVTSGVTSVSENLVNSDIDVIDKTVTLGVTSPPHTPLTTKQELKDDEEDKPPLVPPKQKRQRTRRVESVATTVPSLDEFEVTDEMRAIAIGYGVPAEAIDLETQKWFWHHEAKESRFKNWRSSWYGWMMRAPEMSGYNRRKSQQNGVVRMTEDGLPLMANGAVDLSAARKMGLLG